MNKQHSKRLLKFLSDGEPHTTEEIRIALGLTQKQTESAISGCRQTGSLETIPTRYQITDKGRDRAAHAPLTYQQKLARAAEVRRREREARQLANEQWAANMEARRREVKQTGRPPSGPTKEVMSMVRSAIATRPALDMVWMSVGREQEASHV